MSSMEEPTQRMPAHARLEAGDDASDASGATVVPGSILIDRYEMKALVGRGGMAEVWQAEDLLLHRPVAIKLFIAGTGHDARRRAEAVALARLSHPGLVVVFDAVLSDEDVGQRSFLVTEFVDGPNLRQRLDQADGGIASAEVAQLGSQLADALAYVHAAGIVHRDLKPANVLLDRVEAGTPVRAKLADFGIALLVDSTRLTDYGTTIGTANYLSPEQVSGSSVGPASDVYSLGLVLIECLSGQLAYPGNGIEAAVARLHRPPRLPDGASVQWRELLSEMVADRPHDRPTAATVAATLGSLPKAADVASPETAGPELAAPEQTDEGSPTRLLDDGPSASERTRAMTGSQARLGTTDASHRFFSRWVIAAVVAVVVAAGVIALIVVLSPGSGSSAGNTPPPAYPTVAGKLGRDLTTLQQDVRR